MAGQRSRVRHGEHEFAGGALVMAGRFAKPV
jgi:hypothetical protein